MLSAPFAPDAVGGVVEVDGRPWVITALSPTNAVTGLRELTAREWAILWWRNWRVHLLPWWRTYREFTWGNRNRVNWTHDFVDHDVYLFGWSWSNGYTDPVWLIEWEVHMPRWMGWLADRHLERKQR